MITSERRNQILNLIREHGNVRVSNLTQLFDVSDVTIRNDLDELAKQEVLTRTHGGAIANTGTPLDIAFSRRARTHRAEKERIGKVAAELINPGEIILLDGGTTNYHLSANVADKRNVIFITVGLNIAERVASFNQDATILLTAGELNRHTLAVEGPQVSESLQGLNVDKLFLAIHAVDVEKGLTELTLSQASTKKALIETSRQIILVADSSKFGDVAFATVASLQDVDILVTDSSLPQEIKAQIEEMGVRVLLA